MLKDTRRLSLPARKIIEDLALRSGSPDREAVCPYQGMYKIVKEQFPRHLPDALYELISLQKDYTVGPLDGQQHPKIGEYISGAKAELTDLTRLEDIDKSWVEAYFRNMLTGIKINREDSISAYEKAAKVKDLYTDSESGATSDPSDYVEEKASYSAIEALKWRDKLPYILKRLHEKSKEVKIHLLSLVFAYEKARVEAMSYERKIKPQDIIDKEIYGMNPNGTIGLLLKENKHQTHEYLKWIRGEGEHDEYLDNVLELVYICNRLGIDLTKESAFDYQEDYINSLVVVYITANKDLGKRINREVLNGLKGLSIRDFSKSRQASAVASFDALVRSKVNQFMCSTAPDIVCYRGNPPDFADARNVHMEMTTLVTQLSYAVGASEKIAKNTPVCDGFYMSTDRGTYLTVDVRSIFVPKTEDSKLRICRALVHSSGFLVLVTGTLSMYYLDYRKARAYLTDVFNHNVKDETRYDNKTKFGTWEEARI